MPIPSFRLKIPKAEAENQLRSKIQEGERLKARLSPIRHLATKIKRENSQYVTTNITMLVNMCDNPKVAESFEKYYADHPNPRVSDFFGERQFYLALISEQIDDLTGILRSLVFVQEAPKEEASTPTTAPKEEASTPTTVPPPLVESDANQSENIDDSRRSKTLKERFEAHPVPFVFSLVAAAFLAGTAITSQVYSFRIDNEKSKYEAIIENQKKEYESQLRELRAKVRELESRASDKPSNTPPSDK